MTGEYNPLPISNKKCIKKMEKKLYFDPEMEVIELQLEGALLDGSDGKPTPKDDTPGDDDDF